MQSSRHKILRSDELTVWRNDWLPLNAEGMEQRGKLGLELLEKALCEQGMPLLGEQYCL